MADHFMNHQLHVNMSHKFDTQENAFVVKANQVCKKENQIFLNYGALPNVRLLHLMGFTIPENPYDCYDIWAPMSTEDPLSAYKEQLLESHNINVNKSFPLTLQDVNQELLTVLKVQRMEPQEFVAAENVWTNKSISKKNDIAAVTALESACQGLLQNYTTTTLQEDEAMLAGTGNTQNNNNGSVNMRNILHLRIGEKKVLQATLDNIAILKKKLGL